MGGVDDAGHHGNAQAGDDADADRERGHAEFGGAQTRADGCERNQRRARYWEEPTSDERAHIPLMLGGLSPAKGARSLRAGQPPKSAMSSRWIISVRPAIPRICAISRELRPRIRSAWSAS